METRVVAVRFDDEAILMVQTDASDDDVLDALDNVANGIYEDVGLALLAGGFQVRMMASADVIINWK